MAGKEDPYGHYPGQEESQRGGGGGGERSILGDTLRTFRDKYHSHSHPQQQQPYGQTAPPVSSDFFTSLLLCAFWLTVFRVRLQVLKVTNKLSLRRLTLAPDKPTPLIMKSHQKAIWYRAYLGKSKGWVPSLPKRLAPTLTPKLTLNTGPKGELREMLRLGLGALLLSGAIAMRSGTLMDAAICMLSRELWKAPESPFGSSIVSF